MERRHGLEQLGPGPQDTDAVRPVGLVAGEDVEIDAERGQVERPVRRTLRAVQHHLGADGPGGSDDRAHIEQRAG